MNRRNQFKKIYQLVLILLINYPSGLNRNLIKTCYLAHHGIRFVEKLI